MAITQKIRSVGLPSLGMEIDTHAIAAAIASVDSTNCFGSIGTFVTNVRGWRVDRQPTPGEFVNIQVQRNGVRGRATTVAGVLIPLRLNSAGSKLLPHGGRNEVNEAKHSELTRAIRKALLASMKSHKLVPGARNGTMSLYELDGNFSAATADA